MTVEVPGADPDAEEFRYDEFAYFHENCDEYGLTLGDPPRVERVEHALDDGRRLSGLRWGEGPPRVVLLHGGAQNAHTWDTVALALRPVPVLAVDLPGHGRSDWRTDRAYDPVSNAADVAAMVEALAPDAEVLVGMSLGGLTAVALTDARPDLVRRLVLVDITPGVTRDKAAEVHAFIEGPQSFGSFGEIFARTVEFNPTRTPESLRRGILHNAHRAGDGTWEWNYDRRPLAGDPQAMGPERLWDAIGASTVPLLLVQGGVSPVVDDDDVAELQRRRPGARVVVVDGAGHSVQGDRPIELTELLAAELTA
ncbi:MAG: alpha/beta fold hydrolase [Microthrixaceae bacterium]